MVSNECLTYSNTLENSDRYVKIAKGYSKEPLNYALILYSILTKTDQDDKS